LDYFIGCEGIKTIDILVNSAAGNFLSPFSKLSPNAFKTIVDIDLLGTFLVSQAVYKRFYQDKDQNKHKTIINISALMHLSGKVLQIHAGAA
jgi:peroxisomal 2,4-dienoyl-CoA reductase